MFKVLRELLCQQFLLVEAPELLLSAWVLFLNLLFASIAAQGEVVGTALLAGADSIGRLTL